MEGSITINASKEAALLIRDIILPDDLDAITRLWFEYLRWGNTTMQERYGVHPHDPAEAVANDVRTIGKFQPPHGRLAVAVSGGTICGVGSLKSITPEIGEIKRMYVDPNYRGIGAGKAILSFLLQGAKEAGYGSVRLDSPKFMEAAHRLYRGAGFRDIPYYPEMEIPAEFKEYLVFMELDLREWKG